MAVGRKSSCDRIHQKQPTIPFPLFFLPQVQGVYFRATTVDTARRIGVVGWCRNTRRGTVEGVAQGERGKIEDFKQWLHTGPPAARVDKVAISEERSVQEVEFEGFDRLATV